MSKLFDRLQYNFYPPNSSVIFEYSDDVKESMNSLPQLLPSWGYEDMVNNSVTGYTKNPVAESVQLIINTCNLIYTTANAGANTLQNIANSASLCKNTAIDFYNHTNRLSGVVEINEDTVLLPHYDTAVAVGKIVTHLVHQADGYSNGSTILGSFTSLFVDDDLVVHYNSIKDYSNTINNSISVEEVDDGNGNSEITWSSNLSNDNVNTIISTIDGVTNYLYGRRVHDENFFNRSKDIVTDYTKLKGFMDIGQTETYLLKNYLMTGKLKNRLG